MSQRTNFIQDVNRKLFAFSDLCDQYGISRKTGYKWYNRYLKEGVLFLFEKNRIPRRAHNRTDSIVEELILNTRRKHPSWGAKKIIRIIKSSHPDLKLPHRSTICELFKRHKLTKHRRRKPNPGHPGKPNTPIDYPNQLWSVDFKGHFKTKDGKYCYPLTIEDAYSRKLLCCQGLERPTFRATKAVFIKIFKLYGLPERIRSDNGSPFASLSIKRLSKLSVWWMKLGIYPELIEPGKPSQNGRHERMHRTLKEETTIPPAGNIRAQQRKFNRFREEYNNVRPHEALGQETPSSVYQESKKKMPLQINKYEYPSHYEIRYVSANGGIRWHHKWVMVGTPLIGEDIGFEEIGAGIWSVYLYQFRIGYFHEKIMRIEDERGIIYKHKV